MLKGNGNKTSQEKISKKIKKVLDKPLRLCYNKDVKRKTSYEIKKFGLRPTARKELIP